MRGYVDLLLGLDVITMITVLAFIIFFGVLGGYFLLFKHKILFILFWFVSFTLFFYFLNPKGIKIYIIVFILQNAISILIFLPKWIFNLFERPTKWKVILPTRRGKLPLGNIKRGVALFGSAGAGKTESTFMPLLKHASDFNFSGINYDYKNGELTRYSLWFFKNNETVKSYTVCLHEPKYSHRINPIDPVYLKRIDDVNNFVKVLFLNLRDEKQNNVGFFDKVPEAALRGVIWRLRCDYKEYCTLPHAIAICLMKPLKQLAEFILPNELARLTASPFFASFDEAKEGEAIGAGANDQLRGIKASLDNALSELVSPSLFWILSDSDFNLELNNKENPKFLNIMNNPAKEDVYTPYIAFIINVALSQMRDEKKNHSLLLFDEAPTLRFPKFSRIPSTLRSFDIATVYCTQDIALANETQGNLSTKGILSNLSYQLVGKTNDPDSIKYYKSMTEEVREKEISRARSGQFAFLGDRITESKRWTPKYKTQDYMGLDQGQFIVYADGKDQKVQIDLIDFEQVELPIVTDVTEELINLNFEHIIKIAKDIK